MERIVCDIDPMAFPWTYSKAHFEAWCVDQLKEAGIPVKGTLAFRGMERGILSRINDPERPHNLHFIWTDEK